MYNQIFSFDFFIIVVLEVQCDIFKSSYYVS
jgi:hypothetical protein